MSYILEKAVEKFLDPSIPEWGPYEEELDPPMRPAEKGCDPALPGNGLAEHDMLYIGEGLNRIFLVKDGKVVWKYDAGSGNELDDIWLLTNGDIVFSRMYWAARITPDKKQIWRMDAPEGTEIHTLQPIDLDRVAVVLNKEYEPHLLIVNTTTGVTESDRIFPYWGDPGSHGQNRRFRITDKGTYLVSYLSGRRVVEFDKDFNEIWSYDVRQPWAAIRLKNGNTLISDEADESIVELTSDKQIVWKLTQEELGEYRLEGTQSCVRLENGNTILCARGNGGKTAQLVEVTPDKKVVWVLKDWKNLGPASAIQVLNDGGIPENPGECQR